MLRAIILSLTAATSLGLVGAVRLGAPADAAPPTTSCLPFVCEPPTTPPADPPVVPCSPFECPTPSTTTLPRPPQHIYVPEHYGVEFNAQPGDTVTVIMDPLVPFWTDRCEAMGGTIDADALSAQHIYYCDGVDF